METPYEQDIVVTLLPTSTVRTQNCQAAHVVLPRSILPYSSISLPKPIAAFIADLEKPQIGAPLATKTKLLYRATVARVNQAFPLVDAQATTVFLSYALELSHPYGISAVVAGGEALLVVDVRNMANKPIGIDAVLERHAKIVLASFWNNNRAPGGGNDNTWAKLQQHIGLLSDIFKQHANRFFG